MANTSPQLWCLIEGETSTFPIAFSDGSIHNLKDMIKAEAGVDLATYKLDLWKVDVDFVEIEAAIQRDGKYRFDTTGKQPLRPAKQIFQVWPQPPSSVSDQLHIYVKLNMGSPNLVEVDATDQLVDILGQDLPRFRGSCLGIIINVASGDRAKVFSVEDVKRNGFVENRNTRHPYFVENFWRDMVDKLDIEIDGFVDNCLDASKLFESLLQEYREGLHLLTSEDEEQVMGPNGLDILYHLLSAASFKSKFWSQSDGGPVRLSEEDTMHIFFKRLAKSGLLPDEAECLFRQSWPMTLAVRVDGLEKLKTYRPMSDFSICINNFPRLIWEVCSDLSKHKDKHRMRACGTSIVKFGNYILEDIGRPPHFILVAIYQTVSEAIISTFYEENGKIYQREEQLSLTHEFGRFEFTRRLYKLAKIFESDDRNAFYDHSFVGGLADYIKTNEFDGTVYSEKRKTDTGTSLNGGGEGEATGSGATVQGYELIMNDKDVLEPLYKLPSHIHRMRRHADTSGTLYIVKECRQGSDEAKILKFLQALKPPCKHIIPLVETIQTNTGTCVVFPERQSIKEQLHCFTDGGELRGMFLDLSRDLTIGLSFLHKNGIAHLDIKPSNLVYTNEPRPRLEIIDFDVAVQVQNEEEEIDDYCGTRGWMAPEIGEENGPRRMYSPMRADKWSCGRVLRLFSERHGKADEGLRGFAARLMNGNPRNRPPLLEWHERRTKVSIVVPKKRQRVEVNVHWQ